MRRCDGEDRVSNRWGALRACFFADDNIGGFQKIPGRALRAARRHTGEEMGELRATVQRASSRPAFIQLDPFTIGPAYFPLKRGEFIQGLLASIRDNLRVYVVYCARSGTIRRTGGLIGRGSFRLERRLTLRGLEAWAHGGTTHASWQ